MPCPVRLTGRGLLLRVLLMWQRCPLRPARLRPPGLRPAGLRPGARVRRSLVLVARPPRRGSRRSTLRMWRPSWRVPRRLLLRRRLPLLVLAGIVVGWIVRGWLRRVGAGPIPSLVALSPCGRRRQRLVGCFWQCGSTCSACKGFPGRSRCYKLFCKNSYILTIVLTGKGSALGAGGKGASVGVAGGGRPSHALPSAARPEGCCPLSRVVPDLGAGAA